MQDKLFAINGHNLDIIQSKSSRVVHDTIHHFHRHAKLFVNDEHITSMLCAISLFSSDRPNIVDHDRVEQFQHYYTCVLQNYVTGAKKQSVSKFAVSFILYHSY